MFNIGGGELLVIMLVALLVLGPDKLPGAAKQAGEFLSNLRSMSNDFRQEVKDAVPDEVLDLKREVDQTRQSFKRTASDLEIEAKAREKGRRLVAQDEPSKKPPETPWPARSVALSAAATAGTTDSNETDAPSADEVGDDTVAPPISTAETAGMFAGEQPVTATEAEASDAEKPTNALADEPTDEPA